MNPHQTTLFKLLDSYLLQLSAASKLEDLGTASCSQDIEIFSQITTILSTKFIELILNAQSSIRHSLGPLSTDSVASKDSANSNPNLPLETEGDMSATAPLKSLDVLLPKVCEATVLVAQCFCTMSLDQDSHSSISHGAQYVRESLAGSISPGGDGLVENLIGIARICSIISLLYRRVSPPPPLYCSINRLTDYTVHFRITSPTRCFSSTNYVW